jgi:pimeloyl-ACP methyl ester carboxylesterase
MTLHHVRRGAGKPLLLVHGLGSSRRTWSLMMLALAGRREVIAIDLPGHGDSPAEQDSGTFAGLARSLDAWLGAQGLAGVDMVGSSLGGRLVLEMARRGRSGAVLALDPGGFWEGWERQYLWTTLSASGALVRALAPALPVLAHNAAARSALLVQLSARPWALSGDLVEAELEAIAATPSFDALVQDLAFGPVQQGPAAPGAGAITIGWGRHDRLTLPVQAERALAAFPGARLHWFEHSGHFPIWDEPDAAAQLILEATGESAQLDLAEPLLEEFV